MIFEDLIVAKLFDEICLGVLWIHEKDWKKIIKILLVTNKVNKGDSSICIRLMLSNDYESNLAIMSFDQIQ